MSAPPNTASIGRRGFVAVFEHFLGFEFSLLSNIVPAASNADRWALASRKKNDPRKQRSIVKLKLRNKLLMRLVVSLSIGSIAGCTPLTLVPTSTPLATMTLVACQPSPIQITQIQIPEIQGKMMTDGEMWALVFFDKSHTNEDLKIVWRITGTGKQFVVQGRHEDGTVISPTWGPEDHGSSNWDRPGYEWGTGFNFPKPGCWTLTATRGTTIGEIRLEVLPP